MCSPNSCKGVFNSNNNSAQLNYTEGLHLSAFYLERQVMYMQSAGFLCIGTKVVGVQQLSMVYI